VHLRRALILFALVLGLTALAASIAPAPRVREDTAVTPPAPPPPPATAPAEVRTLAFNAPPPRRGPSTRKVLPGDHVVVQVASARAGDVRIPRLGRTGTVTPSAPARFDLLAPPPGRYDVIFEPPLALGAPVRVGTLVSEG
jgi:hypothetical protein